MRLNALTNKLQGHMHACTYDADTYIILWFAPEVFAQEGQYVEELCEAICTYT